MKETEILNSANFMNLKELSLGKTKTKALNLCHLKNMQSLNRLYLAGHSKNIEAVGELSNLEHLKNIREIEENTIETLQITQVRGFNDIGNISNFKRLKTLLIEDNIQLSGIHFDSEPTVLKDLKIINCKMLTTLSGLANLTALKKLSIYQTALDFETIIDQQLSPTLKYFAFYTAKAKINNEIKNKIIAKGYETR